MDAATKKWRYIALGSACVAAIASVAILRQRLAVRKEQLRDGRSTTDAASRWKTASCVNTVARAPPPTKRTIEISWDTLESWANGLKKRDMEDLPILLEWTERLLLEQPTHQALPACLTALAQLVGSHREADRVSAVAVKAGAREPELALEVLNVLFKDRNKRGGYVADSGVVELALGVLQKSIGGAGTRGVYQRACRLLDFLALEPQNRAVLSSRGGLDVLLQVMMKFENDPGVSLEGCACLLSVAKEPRLDSQRAIAVSTACLQNFGENGQLQWRALAALHALPPPSKDLAIPIAELACAAVSKHPRFDSVVEWTAKVLHRLASDKNTGVKDWLVGADRLPWLERFRDAPYSLRQPNNGQADIWVSKLCSLCLR